MVHNYFVHQMYYIKCILNILLHNTLYEHTIHILKMLCIQISICIFARLCYACMNPILWICQRIASPGGGFLEKINRSTNQQSPGTGDFKRIYWDILLIEWNVQPVDDIYTIYIYIHIVYIYIYT